MSEIMRITKSSYQNLRQRNQRFAVWQEEGKYFCDLSAVTEANQELVSQQPKYKIYRYVNKPVDSYAHPGSIIFPENLNKHLPKKQFIALGERRKTIYFDRVEEGIYQEPIIKVDYKFNRDELGYLFSKEREISWRLEDDTWSDEVQLDLIPVASSQERLDEIKRRRSNIILEAAGLSKDIGLETAMSELYDKYLTEIELYKNSGSPSFARALEEDRELSWLDEPTPANPKETVREFLMRYFLIATFGNAETSSRTLKLF